MLIGNCALAQMLSAQHRLCGQCSVPPSGVDDQSMLRNSAPVSPPEAKTFSKASTTSCWARSVAAASSGRPERCLCERALMDAKRAEGCIRSCGQSSIAGTLPGNPGNCEYNAALCDLQSEWRMKVVVLGSGVIGVTSAYFLAQAGHEVLVLERQK